jgi:hypothetical protein
MCWFPSTNQFPSEESEIVCTSSLCPWSTRVIILVDRSQPQMALSDTDSNRCPSGVNTTQYTHPSWPRKAPKTSEPVVESHMRIVSSVEPEATQLPSSENATAKTLSVWPINVGRTATLEIASPIRTVLSLDPDAICRPSAEYATKSMWPVCPRKGPRS